MALVDATNPSRPKQLAPRAYLQQIAYDEANRVVTETTGVTSTALQGAGGSSTVTSVWDKRGAVSAVTSSYGDLVSRVTRDAQGRVTEIAYADAAKTTTQMVYDVRGRLVNTQTFRTKPSWWAAGGTGAPVSYKAPASTDPVQQLVLESRSVSYDEADNPVLIADGRTAAEWPAGAKPVTKRMTYDDAYRVTRVEYLSPSGASVSAGTPTTDTWVDPFDAEDRATPLATSASTATANPRPVPHVKLQARVKSEAYAYDSLGNILTSSDDANAFWDRSLGAQSHGGSVAGPYQLRSATNRTTASGSLYKGGLEAQYDAAGNLTAMIVQRDAASTTALPSGASLWQRYAYAWDEVGRLMTASRWDLKTSTTASANERTNSGTLAQAAPTRRPDARMAYLYDGADERVVKTTTDAAGASRHTVDVFANYKLRLTKQAGTGTLADYTLDGTTEQVELQSHGVTVARVEVMPTTASTVTTPGQRTLLVLHDALGSAGIVLDRATGQLAEAVTYTAYGQTESDLRPTRFTSSREDERFTGKEEDVEIGLVYFGKRYLVPAMARWASADPLAVHAPGEADLNLYAYVHGRVFVAVDAEGLADRPAPDPASFSPAFYRGLAKIEDDQNFERGSLLRIMYAESRMHHDAQALDKSGKAAGGFGLMQNVDPSVGRLMFGEHVKGKWIDPTQGRELSAAEWRGMDKLAKELMRESPENQLHVVRGYWTAMFGEKGWPGMKKANSEQLHIRAGGGKGTGGLGEVVFHGELVVSVDILRNYDGNSGLDRNKDRRVTGSEVVAAQQKAVREPQFGGFAEAFERATASESAESGSAAGVSGAGLTEQHP